MCLCLYVSLAQRPPLSTVLGCAHSVLEMGSLMFWRHDCVCLLVRGELEALKQAMEELKTEFGLR